MTHGHCGDEICSRRPWQHGFYHTHILRVAHKAHNFLFTPLLCSTTVGTLEFRSIIQPIRQSAGFRQSEHFHLSNAIKIDTQKRVVKCQSILDENHTYDLTYDKLVIALGAQPSTFGIEGVLKYAYFLKEVDDARKIRNKILDNFELATDHRHDEEYRRKMLSFVIVGGGPTGVEFGAELYDFLRQDCKKIFPDTLIENNVSVKLIEASKILNSFDDRLQKYAEKKIEERKNFELIQGVVKEISKDFVVLKSGEKLPYGLCVWSAGLAPRNVIKNGLDPSVKLNKQGQILTNEHLQLLSDPNETSGSVFAIGDCQALEMHNLPQTVAERQGKYLSKLLETTASGASILQQPQFSFKSMGMLAYVGDYKAVSDLPKLPITGVTSWLLWRSAYLTRLGSLRLRLQVPFDWCKSFFWGRDTSRF